MSQMKIEVLFPEVANLYGDLSNIEYLKKCLNDDVEIIETSLNDEPAFVKQNDINLIFMAGMTEKSQEIVIKKLKPYADRMEELVDKNQPILLLGNAMDLPMICCVKPKKMIFSMKGCPLSPRMLHSYPICFLQSLTSSEWNSLK